MTFHSPVDVAEISLGVCFFLRQDCHKPKLSSRVGRHFRIDVSCLVTAGSVDVLFWLLLYIHCCFFHSLCRVQFFATPWTVARQPALSTGCPRQEYWSGLPFPSQGYALLHLLYVPAPSLLFPWSVLPGVGEFLSLCEDQFLVLLIFIVYLKLIFIKIDNRQGPTVYLLFDPLPGKA